MLTLDRIKKIPKKPLSNFELESYAESIPYFRGCFMRDQLPYCAKRIECAIINLDTSSGPGTHWVCYIKRGNRVNYYDSFAVTPPVELLHYWGDKAVVSFNYSVDQKSGEVICGHLCLKFLVKNCQKVYK